MSKSPWGNIGAWAADAERAEAEEREAAEKAATAQPPPSFPSLKEAVVTATKQKRKTKMTLQEFTMQPSSTYSGSAASRGLTHGEMLRLPTRPKERSADDMQQERLGGGFSSYGIRPGSIGSNQGRTREYEGRRSYGFQDEDRRGPPRVSEMDQPSRADEVDNWASMKKQIVPEYNSGQARPGEKYSSLGGGGGPGVVSLADEVDNWASVKKTISQPPPQNRSSSFVSGFSRQEPDRWTRNEQRLVSDFPKSEVDVVVKVNKANPFGAARPREEVLAEKGFDWKKLGLDIEGKKLQHSVGCGSRPASSQSSRPDSPLSSKSELTVGESGMKQKPKVNPFGNAKPREVLLEEKGLDWKKIDLELEHRGIERPETEEEKNLKEEIELLQKDLQQRSSDDRTSTQDLILEKEHEMETLARQLDDKVRYSQKNFEKQVSGGGFYERPPSRSSTGSMERPPSRGAGAYEDPRCHNNNNNNNSFGERERPPFESRRPGSRERPRSRQGGYEESGRGGFPRRSSFSAGGGYEKGRGEYNERESDDRRGAAGQGGGGSRGRGFFGSSRDIDRSGSRW